MSAQIAVSFIGRWKVLGMKGQVVMRHGNLIHGVRQKPLLWVRLLSVARRLLACKIGYHLAQS
jgi:hypothetical protein